MRTPAAAHLSTIAPCQSDSGPSNHSRTDGGDRRTDALGVGQLAPRRPPGSPPSSRTPWPAPAPRSGRRGGSTARPAPATAAPAWRSSRLASSRCAVGASSCGPVLALLRRAGEQRRSASSLASSRSKTSPSSSITPGVEQRHGGLVAQALDVEGAAAGDVEDPLAHLGRAALGGWGSGGPCRPPSAATSGVPHAGHLVGITHCRQALGAQRRAPDRGSRGSRRRPCAGSRCRRGGRPCA